MKNSRPRIKYSQTPHSISRRIETITNKTAAALLSLINRKTVGFGQGFVDLAYRQIATELKVNPRTITTAAKKLEAWGDIIRERVSHGIYRWRVVLDRDEVLEDPRRTYATRNEVRIDRSGPCGSIDQDHADRSIRTHGQGGEHLKTCHGGVCVADFEQKDPTLKKLLKETDLKKQQHTHGGGESCWGHKSLPTQKVRNTDDEPLHKFCLRSLLKYGVSQRVARKLCRDHEHSLIKEVLDLVPHISGIENVAGYLVSAIKDGGYRCLESKKNAHQISGGRSNYAHLTDNNIKRDRHSIVKGSTGSPRACKTVEKTREEAKSLEAERILKEKRYAEETKTLSKRFQQLSDDVKTALRTLALDRLDEILPKTDKREEMRRDKTFQRLANRDVLGKFFAYLDQGLSSKQALQMT